MRCVSSTDLARVGTHNGSIPQQPFAGELGCLALRGVATVCSDNSSMDARPLGWYCSALHGTRHRHRHRHETDERSTINGWDN
mmetsp:Transcript_12216/g.24853  ORF Transcript_12216/g.24853 Transcript_12216/m.24853 type:complete len:83 (+) Transcript_12216:482-730(+)